jgi:hypothetical protein
LTAENVVKYEVSREEQDAFALANLPAAKTVEAALINWSGWWKLFVCR